MSATAAVGTAAVRVAAFRAAVAICAARAAAVRAARVAAVALAACAPPHAARDPASANVSAPADPVARAPRAAEADGAPVWDAASDHPHGGIPRHVALGVPRDADPADDYLMDKGEFVLSYNPRLRVASWVAWRVAREDLGPAPRARGFHPDAELPRAFPPVVDEDFKASGFDRGHLCPSADRTASPQANRATFVFTNVHPQLHELNAGPWEKLEAFERALAREGHDVYVVAGGVFSRDPPRIGRGVAVPDASFKIVVPLPRGASAVDVDAATPAYAVLVPNRAEVARDPWTKHTTTVRSIEAATGYDYLGRVPRAVQDAIERAAPPPPDERASVY